MDPKELRNLCEAYTAIYDEDLRNELEEMSDEFAGIENLSDEEIDAIVEETIDEMLDEGYDFDEVEEIFEEVILEMNPYAPAGSKAARQYAKSTSASKKQKERGEKIAQVKGAVKSVLGRAKEAVKSGVAKAKEAGREAKFKAVDKPVAAYATKRKLHPAAGMAARSKDPEKRRGLRAKVASDIKSRLQKKIAQAQVDTASAARKAGQAASDVVGRAKQSVKNLAARTKRGAKSMVGKAARSVASGAGKVASRLGEDVDIFDIVLEFLQVEGYAETLEEAEWMMANLLSKDEIDIIVEASCEDDDEKEMKKGKKNKKEEEGEDEEEEELDEATYSAKAARAGKDIGKPGKTFAKIAKSAAKRYGSKERGEKVAGAVLAKLRAKRG